jgi:hypothetical protein
LAKLLQEKSEQGKDRVFRLVALILPPTTVHAAFQVLKEGDRLKKANVAEFFDNVLPGDLKRWVLPLVEPQSGASSGPQPRREILEALLKDSDPALRECTAKAIVRNHWEECLGASPTLIGPEEEFGYG